MASSTIRKAIGAVKDQTSISLAKVAGNIAPDLEVLIVKATTHDNEPADEKYVRQILNLMWHSSGYVNACVLAIAKRLTKTRDWIVALKVLMLVHKLLNEGGTGFEQEIVIVCQRGTRVLDISDFRDEAHSNSWDHSGFVKAYASYLELKLHLMMHVKNASVNDDEKKVYADGYRESRDDFGYGMESRSRTYRDLNEPGREKKNGVTPVRELGPRMVLERFRLLFLLLGRFLASRPTGDSKSTRMVLIAVHLLVKDSLSLYADMSEVLDNLIERFSQMEYALCVKVFDACVSAAKMADELLGFYSWCEEVGAVRSSEFPEVKKISDKQLGTLEGILREKLNTLKSTNETKEENFSAIKDEKAQDTNEIRALPPPEVYHPPTILPPLNKTRHHQVTEDLLNLKDPGETADEQGNKLALALFNEAGAVKTNIAWEDFTTDDEPKVTSAWQNPAAEGGKADWELALVESASNLSKQKADLGGGLDPLLLNGMYDQGTVVQHVNNTQLSGGSASSVALPETGKTTTPMLALPAPDGTVQPVGQQDPFAASLSVPPPSYVQIADMEKKQQLLTQEQQLWQQYASTGMQGQMGLAKIAGTSSYYDAPVQPIMPYGMPQLTGLWQPGGYNYGYY